MDTASAPVHPESASPAASSPTAATPPSPAPPTATRSAPPTPPTSPEGGVALGDVGGLPSADRVIGSTCGFSAPAGYRFPREVIAVGVRWYLRYGLSYRDVEELLAERGVEVDHVTIYRWVQTFTAEFIDAARPAQHAAGDRWFVDEVRHEAPWIRVAGRGLHPPPSA